MSGPFIHYSSYSRGWRPLCDAPSVPGTVRGTLAATEVTCPKCLEQMDREMLGSAIGRSGGGKPSPTNPTPERAGP
jgi:hypothetical protein